MDAVNKKITCKPRLKWKCPPKIALSHNWHVAAGEESEEAKIQKIRERKVPEVVYRRRSYIPSSPSPPLNVQEDHLDESQIPLIPVIPIEESEPPEKNDSSLDGTKVFLPSSPAASQREAHSEIRLSTVGESAVEAGSSTQADVALAAATVVTALMNSKESGIDTDLLVKIFSDPETVKKLIREAGAPSSSKTETVSQMNLLNAYMPLARSKPASVEKVYSEHGSLRKSIDTSSPNPNTVPRKNTDENRAVFEKGKACFSNSVQVKCELNAFDKRVAPVPIPNSLSSQFTFLSQLDLTDHKSTSLPIMPLGTPLPSRSSKPDLDEFKWSDNGYGVPAKADIGPITGRNLFSPDVFVPKSDESFLLPTRMNIYPLPNERQTDFKLKAVLSDAVRPIDSQLMSASSCASRVVPYLFSNQAQPALQLKASLLHQEQASLQNTAPFANLERPSLEVNRPFPNPLQSGVQMMGVAAVNAQPTPFLPKTGPQFHDKSYLKALVQQHGEMQQEQNNSLRFYQQNTKPVQHFDHNVLAMKIQRPCFFFNSPEGCKHGYSCPYVHGQLQNMQLGGVMETHSSKRVKLDGEIFGVHR